VAHQVSAVDSDAALDQDGLPEFDRRTEALIDDRSMSLLKARYAPAGAGIAAATSEARIVSYGRNSVVIEVESSQAGVLVLHDIHYPGWEATVDGERRPILRANLLFRGVEVPAGRHRVEFHFRPMSIENLVAAASDLVESKDEPIRTAVATPVLTRPSLD
jgi:hypothetical protein